MGRLTPLTIAALSTVGRDWHSLSVLEQEQLLDALQAIEMRTADDMLGLAMLARIANLLTPD